MQGYCINCKTLKEIEDPQDVTLKNGRKAYKGKCPDCGRTIYKLKN